MPKFRWKRKEAFDKALLDPRRPDVPDGLDILWRERDGLRIVILTNPTPNIAAKLVKTIYRVEKQASALSIPSFSGVLSNKRIKRGRKSFRKESEPGD